MKNGVTVRLYDEDPLSDDFLGESTPDEEGVVRFSFSEKEFRSIDTPGEKEGDFYFVVFINGTEMYRSPVAVDLDPIRRGSFDYRKRFSIRFRYFSNLVQNIYTYF